MHERAQMQMQMQDEWRARRGGTRTMTVALCGHGRSRRDNTDMLSHNRDSVTVATFRCVAPRSIDTGFFSKQQHAIEPETRSRLGLIETCISAVCACELR